MPNNSVISIVDDNPSVCAGTMAPLNSMGFIAERFGRTDDLVESSCLLCFLLGGGT